MKHQRVRFIQAQRPENSVRELTAKFCFCPTILRGLFVLSSVVHVVYSLGLSYLHRDQILRGLDYCILSQFTGQVRPRNTEDLSTTSLGAERRGLIAIQ